jgi:hypothetical protein
VEVWDLGLRQERGEDQKIFMGGKVEGKSVTGFYIVAVEGWTRGLWIDIFSCLFTYIFYN